MSVKQLSIFLENRPGRVVTIAKVLGDAGCNIIALSVADTKDFGILRLIVDDTAKAQKALSDNGIMTQFNDVTAVEMGSTPGSLAKVLELLMNCGVNVEYMYAIAEPRSIHPVMIFRFDKPAVALEALKNANIHIFTNDDIVAAK